MTAASPALSHRLLPMLAAICFAATSMLLPALVKAKDRAQMSIDLNNVIEANQLTP